MNVTEFLYDVNASYRGTDDDAPTVGTSDATYWLSVANRLIRNYARDTKMARSSLFELREIGTISAGTQEYDLDDDFIAPADKVTVTTTDDQDIDYDLCKPEERDRFMQAAYISGRDPQILTFVDEIVTGAEVVGGTLKVPGIWIPDPLAAAGDTIPVDDPDWLVLATASKLAFNDLTYESKSADLNNEANSLYSQMSLANRRGTNNNPRKARTNVARIMGT